MSINSVVNNLLSTTLFALLSFTSLLGQNLVLNPSFENVTVGNLECNWYTAAAQFDNAMNNWTVPTGGSTDIFNTALGAGCYCSPFSTHPSSVGQQAPRTGNGYVNIVTYGDGGCDPWREYVQGELSTPLVAGQTYEVKFYVSLADKMAVGTNNIGVKFETGAYFNASNCPYYATPDLNYTGPIILDKNGWNEISFCFTPTQSNITHFIIGNFFDDAATNTTPAAGVTSGNTIRYFVDDVSIIETTATSGGDPGIDDTVSICSSTATINLFDELGGTPDATGTWTGPSSLTGGYLGTFDPNTNSAGTYTYEVSGGSTACSTGSGSTSSATVEVLIGSADATIVPAGPFCESDGSITLNAAGTGGVWNGVGVTDPAAGTFDPNTAGAGTHAVSYTIANTCSDSDTIDIDVNPTDDATIDPVSPSCQGTSTITLNAATTGGTWSGNGIVNSITGEFDPDSAGAGTHTITYQTSGQCPNTGTIDIEVLPELSVQAFSDQSICEGESVSLNANALGGDGNYSFTWLDDAGGIVGNTSDITVNPNTTTSYIVQLSDNCNSEIEADTVTIEVNSAPTIDISVDRRTGCVPLTVNLSNNGNPSSNCTWNVDGVSLNECNLSYTFTEAGCYDISLIVEESGCSSSTTLDDYICVDEKAIADFTFTPKELDLIDPEVDFSNQSENANSYVWNFGDGTNSSEINPSHRYPEEGEKYAACLSANTENGCNDTICKTIIVEDEVLFYVPNTFTPDGDSYNEQFQAVFTAGYDPQNFHLTVFNRWGEVIWESYNADAKWDGTYADGTIVKDGTYIWKIEFKTSENDEKITETGHLNVLK